MQKQNGISSLAIILIIIGVVIIIVGGVFAYQYFKKPELGNYLMQRPIQPQNTNGQNSDIKTAGWKTYTNTQYGFEFKYPLLAVSRDISQDVVRLDVTANNSNISGTIAVLVAPKNNSLMSETLADPKGANILNKTDKVGGLTWQKKEIVEVPRNGIGAYGDQMIYYIEKNNLIYSFTCFACVPPPDGSGETNENLANLISTFKFTMPTGITEGQQLKINNLDYSFVFTTDSVKIYDAKNSFLQELKIGKDEMATAKFDSKNYGHQIVTANDDVNYDGYKDLAIEIGNGYGGVNFFYNFYYFNPTTKKFVEVPELKSVCNPNVKYEQKEILSSCKDGPGYSDAIYQWGAPGYMLINIPKIYRIDPASASVGNQVSIYGNNFSGFEGDLNLWIENSSGVKGIIYGDKKFSDESVIKFLIPTSVCQQDTSYSGLPCSATLQLAPGNYKIFVRPWSTESNKVDFTIK